jgi:hypothetical protein
MRHIALFLFAATIMTLCSAWTPSGLTSDGNKPDRGAETLAYDATDMTGDVLATAKSAAEAADNGPDRGCAAYAPNGTCFSYRADLYTWSSGIYPYAPQARIPAEVFP